MRFLIVLLVIALIVWFFFFRKSPIDKKKYPKNSQEETMVECCRCGTYVSSKEAIMVGKKYFCSKKCLD
ncbi:hypothetical protein BKH42_06585 [Helicobacter sp. 13S00482-2]|uniref:PP0621 family protein n=1 Tax=Helicobacter sp. 13S00482-2 TaxID=1476200 RepID=UPI000BA5D194|nr:PP0621 family protein [Helicobacter sp. 13S00482-2]PAF53281.1 hypothetical protein BKH42_06585 [Helicobacter sp. 13S00482-2]